VTEQSFQSPTPENAQESTKIFDISTMQTAWDPFRLSLKITHRKVHRTIQTHGVLKTVALHTERRDKVLVVVTSETP
jgi:hypothetical protein